MNARAAILLCVLAAGSAGAQTPPPTNIVVDAIPGNPGTIVQPDQTPITGGTRYTIGEAQGWRPGGAGGVNLLQSFSDFVLGLGDEALFTANPGFTTENIIARVTGGNPSEIHGRIAADVAGASLYFLNPAGLLFGPTATLDIAGSVHFSTADVLRMEAADGTPLLAFSGDAALALAHPVAFGFLGGPPATITVNGAVLDVGLEDESVQPPRRDVSLVGGDVTLETGSTIRTQTGHILLASAASAGDVVFGDLLPDTSSLATLGDITLDGVSVLAAGVVPCCSLDPGGGTVAVDAGSLTLTGSSLHTGLLAYGDEGTSLAIRLRGDLELTASSIATAFDDLSIEANDVLLSSSSIGTGDSYPSGGNAGHMSIAASGDFLLDGDSSVRSTGVDLPGNIVTGGRIDVVAAGMATLAGDMSTARNSISVTAAGIDLSGDMAVASSGALELEADGPIRITGTLRGSVGSISQGAAFTSIVIDSGGDVTFEGASASLGQSGSGGGDISVSGVNVQATDSDFTAVGQGTLSFTGSESVEFTNVTIVGTATTDFGAGSQNGAAIVLAAPRILLDDAALNTSAVRPAAGVGQTEGGSIGLTADDITVTGGSVLESTGVGFSNPGAITLTASHALVISDQSRVSTTISGQGEDLTQSDARIVLTAPDISLLDGVRITSEAFDEGQNARSIAIDAENRLTLRNATVTAAAEFGGGGGIDVDSGGLIDALGSTIETRVQQSTGNAGNVSVAGANVALNGSRVIASAAAGAGGGITLRGDQVLISADSVLDASSQVGTDGIITIDAPDVNLDSGLAALTTEFLDPSRLLRPSCDVAGASSGSFAVRPRAGAPVSPEELLVASDAPPADAAGVLTQVAMRSASAPEAAFRGGRFGEAALEGERAVRAAAERGDEAAEAAALGQLGNAQTALGDIEGAEANLTRGIQIAMGAANNGLAAELNNDLGNHWSARQEEARALEAYRQSARLAHEAGDRVGEARALANAGRTALRGGDSAAARSLLGESRALLDAVTDERSRIDLGIHLARSYTELAEAGAARDESLVAAHGLLAEAADEARSAGDARSLSYALGNAAHLYELEGRTVEGLYLARQALRAAEPLDAPDLLYRWHWQSARLLRAYGDIPQALEAYRRAVAHLEESRQDTLARYGDAEVNFRRAVAPVYREFVDLLLRLPDDSPGLPARLAEARATMELLKGAELRDYFRDACIAELEARTETIDAIAGTAAIVYPLQLDDRLEVLVSAGGRLHRARSPVPSARLDATAQAFRSTLQQPGSDAWREPARQLYDWIIRPIEPVLKDSGTQTLVFVPGGALRAIPMAALLDGEQFLVERYALAVTPTLSVIDPEPLDRAGVRLFAAGISESVQGQPALPKVPEELAAIREIFGGASLLNAEFRVERVGEAIAEQRPTIVHIASHGLFTGDPQQSYLLAWDAPLTMERLGEMIGVARFRDDPLALLVLSACETAEGDDRAALGLAGVAVRAGARSAMGSLWSISDDAAVELVKGFYRGLDDGDASRAESLRRAQLALLRDPRFAHPFFWSPFLMINNWL
jgi:filamentous hemagglutinin family protein